MAQLRSGRGRAFYESRQEKPDAIFYAQDHSESCLVFLFRNLCFPFHAFEGHRFGEFAAEKRLYIVIQPFGTGGFISARSCDTETRFFHGKS